MTAPAITAGRYFDGDGFVQRLRGALPEGWLTIFAVIVVPMTVAWSLDDAGWVPDLEGGTDYLPWVAALAAILGIAISKLGLGRWRTHLVVGVIGGLLMPVLAGSIVLANRELGWDPGAILERVRAAAAVASRVYEDFAVEGRPFTSEYGHYHIAFGALVWAAGQFAGVTAIGRRRPLDAVVVVGILLLASMLLTQRGDDQLHLLVLFSIAALILLIRTHAFEEEATWIRRRIGDPKVVSGLYLRGGGTFIAGAVLGALVLTGTAASAPLQGLWSDLPAKLAELSRIVQKIAPPGGNPRGIGAVGFGRQATTTGLWSPSNDIAFVAKLPANDHNAYRWRGGTYARYTLYGWEWGDTHDISRGERATLLQGTGDDPALNGARTPVRIEITPQALADLSLISPQAPEWVDRSTTVRGVGEQNRFTQVELATGGGTYTVNVLIPVLGDVPGGITENRLRAASRNYPTDVLSQYGPSQVPDGAIGPAARAIQDEIVAELGGRTAAAARPYDLARAMEAYFLDGRNFQYVTDVQTEMRRDCSGISTVECFARIRRGYCEFYASAYAILLRDLGIPTRVAYGFLASGRTPDGVETVPATSSHWWVEVYFPGYGWIEFDPTGGDRGRPTPIPSGGVVTPPPSGFVTAAPDDETDPPTSSRGVNQPPAGGGPAGAGPFVVVGILLAIAVLVIGYAAYRRSPNRSMEPDTAWGGLARLAARFGFGPRPEQTVYEYAGALGDLVPAFRAEVSTVARAKVETTYARRQLADDRLRRVGEAYRRLRFAVVRLGLRRRLPRPRGRR